MAGQVGGRVRSGILVVMLVVSECDVTDVNGGNWFVRVR